MTKVEIPGVGKGLMSDVTGLKTHTARLERMLVLRMGFGIRSTQ